MMTKRDFEAIAAVFNDSMETMNRPVLNPGHLAGVAAGIEEIAEGMCDMFAKQNPRFNREIFLDACGLGR